MKILFNILLSASLISCVNISNNNNNEHPNTKPIISSNIEKLAGNFSFTEGPAANSMGDVYFTDIPNHLILIWSTENKLDTFRVESGRANGLFFDKDDNLYVCEGGKGQVTKTDSEGYYEPLVTQYNRSRFNQPNDLWPDRKGGIYFTDPLYGENEDNLPQDGMHVYYIVPDRTSVIRVCDDYVKPNGIIGSPDGKILYVTDATGGKTFSYDIQEDGTLKNKKLFVDFGSDGMTVDKDGNVYLTPIGKYTVDVYSPGGEFLESAEFPEMPSNVCFGGKNNDHLYVTARTSIYRVATNTKGIK